MRRFLILLAFLFTITGCTRALPSTASNPAPVASAAQPLVENARAGAYVRQGADLLRARLNQEDLPSLLASVTDQRLQLNQAEVSASCAVAKGDSPVLVCHFGPSAENPVAQAILWHDGSAWRSQLYPQARLDLANERRRFFMAYGGRLGSHGRISAVRQSANGPDRELLVVVDLGPGAGARSEEVQLLHLVDGIWRVEWAPGSGDWHYGHATVTLPGRGTASFRVRNSSWLRSDTLTGYVEETEAGEHRYYQEHWVRKGMAFVLQDRAEEAGPYSTLVHLIHYLSTGADEKASSLLADTVSLNEARKALAQQPRRQGWKVTRSGEGRYLVAADGRPAVQVRLEQQEQTWRLAELSSSN